LVVELDGSSGNHAELIAFWVSHDKEPPVFVSLKPLTAKRFDPVPERADVRAIDIQVSPVLAKSWLRDALEAQSHGVLVAFQPNVRTLPTDDRSSKQGGPEGGNALGVDAVDNDVSDLSGWPILHWMFLPRTAPRSPAQLQSADGSERGAFFLADVDAVPSGRSPI
jgi:hypothetical protein